MTKEEWDKKIEAALENKTLIRIVAQRVAEFASLKFAPYNVLFEELTFCTLTANTSAELGIRCINFLKGVNFQSIQNIQSRLRECGYRFPNTRARFINQNYERSYLLELVKEMDEPEYRRDFIYDNFIGIGYKEGSHFLRNIGYFEYAILDKHILRFLREYFGMEFSNKSRKKYLEAEGQFIKISLNYGIDPGIMDLIIWYIITGKVLK